MTQRAFKTKVSSRVTQREFVMLAILLIAIELFVLVQYVVKPQWQTYTDIKEINNIKELSVAKLKTDFANLSTFKETLATAQSDAATVKAQIPAYVSQEEVIMLIEEKCQLSSAKVGMISFADPVALGGEAFIAQGQADAAAADGAAPAAPAEGQSMATITKETLQEPLLVTQTIAITFNGQYEELMAFFKAMESNLRKVYLQQVTMTAMDDGTLSGSLNLTFMSYIDVNNFDQYQLDLEMNSGRANPFAPYPGFGTEKPVVVVVDPDPNLYVYLNSYLDNAQKVIVGEYLALGTEVNFNENAQTKVKMVIKGDNKAFTYSLSMNGDTSSSDAPVTIKDGVIRVKVVSLDRKDAQDKVGIVLDVDNQSSAPVQIKVLYDDKVNPRVKMGTISDNVTIK